MVARVRRKPWRLCHPAGPEQDKCVQVYLSIRYSTGEQEAGLLHSNYHFLPPGPVLLPLPLAASLMLAVDKEPGAS